MNKYLIEIDGMNTPNPYITYRYKPTISIDDIELIHPKKGQIRILNPKSDSHLPNHLAIIYCKNYDEEYKVESTDLIDLLFRSQAIKEAIDKNLS